MDYLDKLFKQHGFIYYIGGKYYAFGAGICTQCNLDRHPSIESRYNQYIKCQEDSTLTDHDAWLIFHHLVLEAEGCSENVCAEPKKEILKYDFDREEVSQLELEIENYLEFFDKHNLKEYFTHPLV